MRPHSTHSLSVPRITWLFKKPPVNQSLILAVTLMGDRWCLCAARWKEALDAGVAPPVVLSATHASALGYVSLAQLQQRWQRMM